MNNKIIKTLVLLFALSGTIHAQSQYIDANLGGGLHSLQFDPGIGDHSPGWGGRIGISYSYFFNEHWGAGAGLGLAYYQSKCTMNGLDQSLECDTVNDNENYLLKSYYSGWKERQKMLVCELPIGGYYQTNINNGWDFVGGAGFVLQLPVWSKYEVTDGSIKTEGYYLDQHLLVTDLPHHGFGTDEKRYKDRMETNIGIGVFAEAGARYWVKDNLALYGGLYGSYELTDAVDGHNPKLHDANGNYHGTLASNQVGKVSLASFGIKLGVTFLIEKQKRH